MKTIIVNTDAATMLASDKALQIHCQLAPRERKQFAFQTRETYSDVSVVGFLQGVTMMMSVVGLTRRVRFIQVSITYAATRSQRYH